MLLVECYGVVFVEGIEGEVDWFFCWVEFF